MTDLISNRRLQITVTLVLGFFVAVYPVLPSSEHQVQSDVVRMAVSVTFFSVGTALVLGFFSVGLPFAIGIVPILLVLRSGGAIYGAGVDLFYLVVAGVAAYKLRPRDRANRVRVRGSPWLFLFAVQCIVQAALEALRSRTGGLVLTLQIATFYIVVYMMSARLSPDAFRCALYAVITGCVTVLAWTLSAFSASDLLAMRLGYAVGLNPNLLGQFALLLMLSVLLLVVLRRETKLGGISFLVLLFGAVSVFLTGSRVALIQLGLLFLLLLSQFRIARTLTMLACAATLVVLAVGSDVIAAGVGESRQYARLIDFQRADRGDLSQLAWQLATQNPALGVGPGNFVEYSLARGLTEENGEGSYHHDVFAGTAAEFGFVGLGLFLLWYLSFIRSATVGRPYSVFVVVLSAIAMVQGETHGLFLDFFGSLPFLFAVLAERFAQPASGWAGPVPMLWTPAPR